MTNTTAIKDNDYQCLKQAAQWFAIFADGEVSDKEQDEFTQWLESKDNQQAWSFVDGVSQQFTNVRDSEHHDEALTALGNTNTDLNSNLNKSRRNTLKLLSLLPFSVLFSWAGYKNTRLGPVIQASLAGYVNDYATDIGEISHVNLADNSRVSLNTASAINVEYNNKLRLIDLVRGEILITTGKDERHFEVNTAVARLRALGTRFSVRHFSDNTVQLNVFEGSVAIYQGENCQNHMPNTQPNQQYIVKAGQQVMIEQNNIHTSVPVSDTQSSWQQGLLFANEITLEAFVEQVARYRKGYLAVSPDVANLRIMGSFPLDDTDKILSMLSNSLPIKVYSPLPWWQTLEAK